MPPWRVSSSTCSVNPPAQAFVLRRLHWLLLCVLVGAAFWWRLPTWNDSIIFIDEAIYYSFAARLDLPGAHVYTHTADQKPPLGPMTYRFALHISPLHAITVIHVFTTVAIAVTAVLLLVTSQTLLGSPWPGLLAGLLYIIESGSTRWFAFSSLEHFQAPLLISFFLMFLLSARNGRVWLAALAGGALGIALLYKQNVPVLLFAAGWVLAEAVSRGRLRASRAAVLAVAATATTIAIVAAVPTYYALIGHFAAWRLYNVEMLGIYHAMGGSFLQNACFLAGVIPLWSPFLVALVYGTLNAARSQRPGWSGDLSAFLVVGWLVLFASVVPGQHKPHYLIQGLPAECLLIGLLVVDAWNYVARSRGAVRVGLAALYVGLVLYPLAIGTLEFYRGHTDLSALLADDYYLDIHRDHGTLSPVVDYIRSHTAPDDLIYVHSQAPEFYFLTQRRPAASDATGSWIAMAASEDAADRLLADLRATPPRLILQLDYRRYGRASEVLQAWPDIRDWIDRHYREHVHIDHAQILEWEGSPDGKTTRSPE